jgi:DNA-binding transcriptional LysR family regulator
MDLRQLRHFLAVADTLHFGRAAELLGMTQPPLSQSIMALERDVGAPLFSRSKRSVALTPLGRQWLDHVRPAVDRIAALPGIARQLQNGTIGRVALSFVSTADYSVLPRLVREYSAALPEVELRLAEATSDVQIAALIDGSIDAGILIPTRPALPPMLAYLPLVKEPLVAAVPEAWIADHRLVTDDGTIAGDDWMALPLIMFPERVSPDFHELVLGFYRSRNHEPRVRQQAIQMQTIISLVSAAIGIALVPASMRRLARTGVRYVEIAGQPPILETGLAWHKENDAPGLLSLIDTAMRMDPERSVGS